MEEFIEVEILSNKGIVWWHGGGSVVMISEMSGEGFDEKIVEGARKLAKKWCLPLVGDENE